MAMAAKAVGLAGRSLRPPDRTVAVLIHPYFLLTGLIGGRHDASASSGRPRRRATSQASGQEAVRPGLSIPNRLTKPGTP